MRWENALRASVRLIVRSASRRALSVAMPRTVSGMRLPEAVSTDSF